MSKLSLFIVIIISAGFAHAAPKIAHSDLCILEDRENGYAFENEQLFDAKDEYPGVPAFADLIERTVSKLLGKPNLKYSDIRELFSPTGEEKYNDLYVSELISKLTGLKYLEVVTFPGENMYGNIFAADTKKIVAVIEDGDISVLVDGTKTYCSEIAK